MTTSSLYPTHTIICKVPQSSSGFQIQPHRFNHKDQVGFPMPCKEGHLLVDGKNKADIEYPFTLWMAYQYTQSLQRYRRPS